MNNEAEWIPLMDYAIKTGVSLSTLRRHIKANKIPYKVESGKYLLQETGANLHLAPNQPQDHMSSRMRLTEAVVADVAELRSELQKAQEEIAELKMLVAIYEEQLAHLNNPAPASGKSNVLGLNG